MGLWLAWLPWAAGNLDHVLGMQWGWGTPALGWGGDTRDSGVSLGEAWAASLPGPLPQLVSGCAGSFGGLYMG